MICWWAYWLLLCYVNFLALHGEFLRWCLHPIYFWKLQILWCIRPNAEISLFCLVSEFHLVLICRGLNLTVDLSSSQKWSTTCNSISLCLNLLLFASVPVSIISFWSRSHLCLYTISSPYYFLGSLLIFKCNSDQTFIFRIL
jgi:hypothetical protein